jgi:TrmH family RNA methyltransferase
MLAKSKVKYIQTLGQKKFREQTGYFIAEGPRLVDEMIKAQGVELIEIYAVKEWLKAKSSTIKKIDITEVSELELEKISQLKTPNQVLAVARQLPPAVLKANGHLTLVLDTIQDPGNLGTIIRIADWFGVEQIVCSADTADIYSPKVVQSTMGSIARVKIMYTDTIGWVREQEGVRVYATVLEGQDIRTLKKIKEGIILVGNESKGIGPELLELANARITIPGKGNAESLNAAVATGIVLSHLVE